MNRHFYIYIAAAKIPRREATTGKTSLCRSQAKRAHPKMQASTRQSPWFPTSVDKGSR